jgi:hypothetical protein
MLRYFKSTVKKGAKKFMSMVKDVETVKADLLRSAGNALMDPKNRKALGATILSLGVGAIGLGTSLILSAKIV